MDRQDVKFERVVEVLLLERRSRDGSLLSSAEVMKILRLRAPKHTGKRIVTDAQWDEPAR
jgi:hypothetical protein